MRRGPQEKLLDQEESVAAVLTLYFASESRQICPFSESRVRVRKSYIRLLYYAPQACTDVTAEEKLSLFD